MGVIKKTDTKVGLHVAKSEESLNIPQSDDETSSASTVTDSVPVLSIRTRRNIPCPLSFLNRRKHLGKKRNRRYENALQLETWREEEEFEEITIHDLICQSNFGFTKLFENVENMEAWHTFITSTEETQKRIVEYRPKKNNFNQNKTNGLSSFQNIKFGLRNMLKKSHLPLGILNYLEAEVVTCFLKDPQDVYVSGHVSSFERLLLHAVSQYHQLHSFSVNEETTCVRIVKIYNPFHDFKLPEILLGQYLESKKS